MDKDLAKILKALLIPAAMNLLMWASFLVQEFQEVRLNFLGIIPKRIDGLAGIATTIFVHSNLDHILSNSIPFIILAWALFYFYSEFSIKALVLMWLTTGLYVWIIGEPNGVHVGASGLVYALAAFHIASSLLRKVYAIMAFALLVVFLYGSMVWGFFPELFPKQNISWESHLMGTVAGIVAAFYFRKSGIQKPVHDFGDDDELDDGFTNNHLKINYINPSIENTHDSHNPSTRVKREILRESCVETFEEALAAEKNGAQRIELCSNLENDGLTPDYELIKSVKANLSIPIKVMIRPRSGNFTYSDDELETMETQINFCKENQIWGVVIGVLKDDNSIDIEAVERLAKLAYPMNITFHKAIDQTENPINEMVKLIGLVDSILTSGKSATALGGAELINQMTEISKGGISIIAAGKITTDNLHIVVRTLKTNEFHGRKIIPLTNPHDEFI